MLRTTSSSAYALLLVVLTHYKKLRFSFFVLVGGIYGAFFFQKKAETHTDTAHNMVLGASAGHYALLVVLTHY